MTTKKTTVQLLDTNNEPYGHKERVSIDFYLRVSIDNIVHRLSNCGSIFGFNKYDFQYLVWGKTQFNKSSGVATDFLVQNVTAELLEDIANNKKDFLAEVLEYNALFDRELDIQKLTLDQIGSLQFVAYTQQGFRKCHPNYTQIKNYDTTLVGFNEIDTPTCSVKKILHYIKVDHNIEPKVPVAKDYIDTDELLNFIKGILSMELKLEVVRDYIESEAGQRYFGTDGAIEVESVELFVDGEVRIHVNHWGYILPQTCLDEDSLLTNEEEETGLGAPFNKYTLAFNLEDFYDELKEKGEIKE